MKKIKISGETWLEDIINYGIIYLDNSISVKNLLKNEKVLPCTRCSKTKGKVGEEALPKDFYVSSQNLQFYSWCEKNKLKYGILSDMYGMHFWNEKKKFYDIHPSSLTDDDFERLGKLIREKMITNSFDSFLFWNSSPLMSAPYFYMMKLSGLKIFYITKLYPLVKETSSLLQWKRTGGYKKW